jgi:heme/copper-type cytochrome/quinol oxidase subunit 4
MSAAVIWILCFVAYGMGVWTTAVVLRRENFDNATAKEMLIGFLTCVFLPFIALWILDTIATEERKE